MSVAIQSFLKCKWVQTRMMKHSHELFYLQLAKSKRTLIYAGPNGTALQLYYCTVPGTEGSITWIMVNQGNVEVLAAASRLPICLQPSVYQGSHLTPSCCGGYLPFAHGSAKHSHADTDTSPILHILALRCIRKLSNS